MSQFNTSNYEIPRTTGVCAKTGRELQPGETYYAALVELSDEELAEQHASKSAGSSASENANNAAAALGLRRLDVSQEAWEQGYRPDRLFSHWKSTVPEPNEKKKLFVDDGVLMNLLLRLEDAEQPDQLAFRYVLALILMRKRLIRFDATERRTAEASGGGGQTVEQEWWLFTPKVDLAKGPMGKWNEDETIEVLDPQLDESQIEQVTEQLGQVLEGEL